jgi:hypothetical protein
VREMRERNVRHSWPVARLPPRRVTYVDHLRRWGIGHEEAQVLRRVSWCRQDLELEVAHHEGLAPAEQRGVIRCGEGILPIR